MKKIIFILLILSACSSGGHKSGYGGLFDRWSTLPSGARYGRGDLKSDRSLSSSNLIHSEDKKEILKVTHNWQWPLKNAQVTSHFGKRGRRDHEGIDFKAPTGTSIYAVGDGVVVYSNNKISGYGRMVVLKHEKDLFTIYAHHSKNLVKVGERVQQGQKIALSGRSGRVTGPHLHFEFRAGSIPLNPLEYMNPKNSPQRMALVP